MPRFFTIAAVLASLAATGCSTRVELTEQHESDAPPSEHSIERSSTVVVVGRAAPQATTGPDEPQPSPSAPAFRLDGHGNVVVYGEVHQHRHEHFHVHEAPELPEIRVDVRVRVDTISERERRQQAVERRLAELILRRGYRMED